MSTDPALHASVISRKNFFDVFSKYEETRDRFQAHKKDPDHLRNLDDSRYNDIASFVKAREEGEGDAKTGAYITKKELSTLMDWKLSHGTYRPSLKGLIAANDEADVVRITNEGLKAVLSVREAVQKLTELKGVGPATAALLLSVRDPIAKPFFSDELFRWVTADEYKPIDWTKRIKYNVTEYLDLVARIESLRERLGEDVSAVNCEKVAYVLGHEKGQDTSKTKRKHVQDGDPADLPKKKVVREEAQPRLKPITRSQAR